MILPARVKCVSQEVGDETLVYYRGKAHCLNAQASLVFHHCDGKTAVETVMEQLSFDGPAAREYVELTLKMLAKEGLLQEEVTSSVSRRSFLKNWGAVACTLPLITSVLAPQPVAAQSCIPELTCIEGLGGPVTSCMACDRQITGAGCADCVCMTHYFTTGASCIDDEIDRNVCVSQANIAAFDFVNLNCAVARANAIMNPDVESACGTLGVEGADFTSYICCSCMPV